MNESINSEEALFEGLAFDEDWSPSEDLLAYCAELASAFGGTTGLDEKSQLGPASRLTVRCLTLEDAERVRRLASACVTPEGEKSRVIYIDFDIWITQPREEVLFQLDRVARVNGRLLVEEFWLQEEHIQNCDFGFPHLASSTTGYCDLRIDGGVIGDALVPAATVSDYVDYLEYLFKEILGEAELDQVVALAEVQIDLDGLDSRLRDVFLNARDKAKALLSEWEPD